MHFFGETKNAPILPGSTRNSNLSGQGEELISQGSETEVKRVELSAEGLNLIGAQPTPSPGKRLIKTKLIRVGETAGFMPLPDEINWSKCISLNRGGGSG